MIYLTVLRLDITYIVSVVSQFIHDSRKLHWEVICRILRYLKRAPAEGLLYRLSLTGQLVVLIDDLFQVIVHLLVLILLFGATRNRMWLLIRVQTLNIRSWLILLMKFCGFVHYFVVSMCLLLWICIVTINQLFSLLVIRYSMRWLNILKWIIILFEIYWWKRRSSLHVLSLVINCVTFLPSHWVNLPLVVYISTWTFFIFMLQLEGEC